jgi:hypothetical protein
MADPATKPPSDEFKNAFDDHVSGSVRTCECGITYFDGFNRWDWEEGELEDYRKKAKKEPEKYVEIDCAAGCYQIDGREYVWDCPCNGGFKYQSFLLRHATRILAFLDAHAKRLEEEAKELRPSPALMAVKSFPPATTPPTKSPVGKRLITL